MAKFRYLIIVLFLFLGICAKAQVSFVFLPEVHGCTLDGLFQVRLNAPASQKMLVNLNITVTAQKAGRVVTIKTRPFELMPGLNPVPVGLMAGATINFGNNKIAAICRQSGYFTEEEYDYCFELTAADNSHAGDIIGEQCFNYYLQPFSPLLLVTPAEEDDICDKRPTFFWQPLLPAVPGLQYRLILTALKPGQAKAEALRYNLPLINQQFINMPMLFFPPAARELEEGRQYVWQVTAYRNEMILANSEMWTFKISCTDSVKKKVPESFRDIDDLVKGNFYVARGRILFAVHNIYDKTALEYTITCITAPDQVIKKLPSIKLERGNNHVTIDLEDNRSFTDGYYYQLTIKLPDGETKQLRFLYKKETE
ncbi:hypothetical protein CLV51_1035 [Chitinophaga niastensis]|uniref:DUF928 domain-containing protein n=1 Tax=Chitinophaga niastensis TaxID=536980 RepID=A0A2P8HII8_CHINA|nr:DUF928 domain-containing protein [Chitinophaga niastensis]PSL46029.1 hypothetical protein CLV51_1035 [Chitinophaga niastensis]